MISIAVMAHKKRRRFVTELTQQLDCEVVWDHNNNRRETGRRAWQAHDPSASHHLVIQDDAVPCEDLHKGLEELVKHTGNQPISLFYCRTGPRFLPIDLIGRLASQGAYSGIDLEVLYSGVAVMVPTDQIGDMLRFRSRHTAYDIPIWRYYQARGLTFRYTWPSLVDHREMSESQSLLGKDHPGRVAYNFAHSALDVDWSLPVLDAASAILTECGVPMFTWRHPQTGQLLTLATNDRRLRKRPPAAPWERVDQ